MGFLEPSPPPFDLEEWKAKPHLTRLKPLVQDWGVNGFGSPTFVYLLYVVKLIVFSVGGAVRDLADARARLARNLGDWWTRADRLPEAGGLAAALGDPRPRGGLDAAQLPLRAADRGRALLAAAGHGAAAALAGQGAVHQGDDPDRRSTSSYMRACWPTGIFLLAASGVDAGAGSAGKLPPAGIAVLLGLLGLLGLRDKVSFLGARPEIYGTVLIVGLFPVQHWIVAWQFVFFFIWWGAASSKLNHHFPFVVSTMMSNAPLIRSPALQAEAVARLPGGHAAVAAGGGDRPLRHGPGVRLAAAADHASTTTRSGRSRSSG